MTALRLTATRDAASSSMFSGVFGRFAMMMRQAEARRQLLELDDRMLRDIGLSRNEVAAGFSSKG